MQHFPQFKTPKLICVGKLYQFSDFSHDYFSPSEGAPGKSMSTVFRFLPFFGDTASGFTEDFLFLSLDSGVGSSVCGYKN